MWNYGNEEELRENKKHVDWYADDEMNHVTVVQTLDDQSYSSVFDNYERHSDSDTSLTSSHSLHLLKGVSIKLTRVDSLISNDMSSISSKPIGRRISRGRKGNPRTFALKNMLRIVLSSCDRCNYYGKKILEIPVASEKQSHDSLRMRMLLAMVYECHRCSLWLSREGICPEPEARILRYTHNHKKMEDMKSTQQRTYQHIANGDTSRGVSIPIDARCDDCKHQIFIIKRHCPNSLYHSRMRWKLIRQMAYRCDMCRHLLIDDGVIYNDDTPDAKHTSGNSSYCNCNELPDVSVQHTKRRRSCCFKRNYFDAKLSKSPINSMLKCPRRGGRTRSHLNKYSNETTRSKLYPIINECITCSFGKDDIMKTIFPATHSSSDSYKCSRGRILAMVEMAQACVRCGPLLREKGITMKIRL